MKVLGVVGSPRKGGNTDILVDKVLSGAQEKGNMTSKIFLNDLNFLMPTITQNSKARVR